jgi:hypothetical protein
MKPFSKFGMEPTFYPVIKNYPSWWNDSGTWERVVEQISDKIINEKIRHPWWKNAEVDEGVLEVPTTTYTDFKSFKKNWETLHKHLEKYEYTNSSDVCVEAQGGCHINFSLEDLPLRRRWYTGSFSYKGPHPSMWATKSRDVKIENPSITLSYRELFCKNLLAFMASHPSLVWSCLSPHDNISSTIPDSAFAAFAHENVYMRKGEFLTFREREGFFNVSEDDDRDLSRVELRFFMMPRSAAELSFHFELANKILAHVKKMTDQKRAISINTNRRCLKDYTFLKAKKELKEVFRLLDVSYSTYVELGKEDLLKERFEYGKKYLV